MATLITLTDRRAVSLTSPGKIHSSRFRFQSIHGKLAFADDQSPGVLAFDGVLYALPDSRVSEHRDMVAWLNGNIGLRWDYNEAADRFMFTNRGEAAVTVYSPALGWAQTVTVPPGELAVAPNAHALNILTTLLVYSSCGSSLHADPDSGRLVRSDLVAIVPVTAEDRRVGRFHYESQSSVEHVLCGTACERLTLLDLRVCDADGNLVRFAEPVVAAFECQLSL